MIFPPGPDLWRAALLEDRHGWKQLCLSRYVSSACPLLCATIVVPAHLQDLALNLQVTTSQPTQHKGIWARSSYCNGYSTGGAGIKAASEGALHSSMTSQHALKGPQACTSGVMG